MVCFFQNTQIYEQQDIFYRKNHPLRVVFFDIGGTFISIRKKTDTSFDVSVLVRWKGLEPLTYWFVASHSIQLSYQRTAHDIYYHRAIVLSTVFLKKVSIFSKNFSPCSKLPHRVNSGLQFRRQRSALRRREPPVHPDTSARGAAGACPPGRSGGTWPPPHRKSALPRSLPAAE